MDRTKHNAAIITISKEALLGYLQFEGGKVHSIKLDDERWADNIEIVVEHPDLPEVFNGSTLIKITPAYRFWKRGRFIKMLRVDPPKIKT